MSTEGLSIGALAKLAGISVDAARYYERRGLIPRARRRPSGYRVFAPATAERIRFVKSLQDLGFTLSEARGLLEAVDAGEDNCARFRPRVDAVLRRVDDQIAELRKVRRRISILLRACERDECRIGRMAPRVRRDRS